MALTRIKIQPHTIRWPLPPDSPHATDDMALHAKWLWIHWEYVYWWGEGVICADDMGVCKDGVADFSHQCINGRVTLNWLATTDLE